MDHIQRLIQSGYSIQFSKGYIDDEDESDDEGDEGCCFKLKIVGKGSSYILQKKTFEEIEQFMNDIGSRIK